MNATPEPAYRQIAADLRERISSGHLPPGSPIPTEQELIDQYGVSRGTVRHAIASLRNEGLIVTSRRRGSHVRPVLPVKRLGSDRYQRDLDAARAGQQQTSVTHEYGIEWRHHRPKVTITEEPATAEVAELFGVPAGTMLSRRDLVFQVGGWPVQMATSYYLLDMVAGTWVVTPESEPTPGGMCGHLLAVGVTPTEVEDRATARLATERETETLRIAPGSAVLVLTRITYAGERVVEVAHEITIPGANVVLVNRVKLT